MNHRTQPFSIIRSLLVGEFWIIGGLVLLTFIDQAFLLPTVLIATVLILLRGWINGIEGIRTPIDWSILILILTLAFSYLVTNALEDTHIQVLRLLSGIAIFYAASHSLQSFQQKKFAIYCITIIGCGISLITIIGIEWTPEFLPVFLPFYHNFPVLINDTANPNVIAGNLGLFIPFMLGIQLSNQDSFSKLSRIFIWFGLLVMSASLIGTQSRAGLFSVFLSIVGIIILKNNWLSSKLAILSTLALTVGLMIISVIAFGILLDEIPNNLLLVFEPRFYKWELAISLINLYPLTGVGLGSFQATAFLLDKILITAPGLPAHAHNLFLQITVDLGIPGIIAWLSVFITISFLAWKLSQQNQNKLFKGIGMGIIGTQIAIIIHGLFDSVIWGIVRPAPLIWGLWGLAASCWLMRKKTGSSQIEFQRR